MAVEKKTRTIPAKTVEETSAVVCELCGARGKGPEWPVGGDWAKGTYQVLKTHVGVIVGRSYPFGRGVREPDPRHLPHVLRGEVDPLVRRPGREGAS